MTREWTAAEVADLPVVVDIPTAGSVLQLSRSQSYELARRGEFPVPVLQVGQRYRVIRQDLLELLGLAEPVPKASPRAGAPPGLRRVSGL